MNHRIVCSDELQNTNVAKKLMKKAWRFWFKTDANPKR